MPKYHYYNSSFPLVIVVINWRCLWQPRREVFVSPSLKTSFVHRYASNARSKYFSSMHLKILLNWKKVLKTNYPEMTSDVCKSTMCDEKCQAKHINKEFLNSSRCHCLLLSHVQFRGSWRIIPARAVSWTGFQSSVH